VRCSLDQQALMARVLQLPKLLQPIVPPGRTLLCKPRLLARQTVLSLYMGSEPLDLEPDSWRFQTKIPHIRGAYYERWLPSDYRKVQWYLDRAYLHLYARREGDSEDEIMALHCDPNESQSERHYRYKAGPHIHMVTAEDPLPRSHIALNNDNFDKILSSISTLTAALKTAIVMVDDQVLALYGRSDK